MQYKETIPTQYGQLETYLNQEMEYKIQLRENRFGPSTAQTTVSNLEDLQQLLVQPETTAQILSNKAET